VTFFVSRQVVFHHASLTRIFEMILAIQQVPIQESVVAASASFFSNLFVCGVVRIASLMIFNNFMWSTVRETLSARKLGLWSGVRASGA
jgi:hypothetical protein